MGEKWLNKFQKLLNQEAPTITIEGTGRSRRIEDYYHDEVEVERQCYENVFCYVQKGLGAKLKQVHEILHSVHSFQNDRERGSYTLNIYLLGSEMSKLERASSYALDHNTNAKAIAQRLCKASGEEASKTPSFVAKFHLTTYHDLIIFFCHDRQILMNTKLAGAYQSRRHRIFWFFLEGPEPEFAMGKDFKPEFVGDDKEVPQQ